MEKLNYPCPCGGKVKWKQDQVIIDNVDCGVLDVEFCEKCGEMYLPSPSLEIVESKLKKAGVWGIERKKINFWKSGNSVIVRIPTDLTEALGIKPHEEGYIYREGNNKFVIEV